MQIQKNNTQKSIFVSIARSVGGITLILAGIKVLGFIEKQVLAYYFGTGYQGDAYFVGFGLMITFWDFLSGLMAPSFLPTLIEYRTKAGETKSWEFVSTVLNLMSAVFLLIIGVALLLTPQAVRIAAPGFVSQASLSETEYQKLIAQFPDVEHALDHEVLQYDRNTIYIDIVRISEEQREKLGEEAFGALGHYATRRFMLAVGLTRLMLTGGAFFAIGILTGLTLNSYKRFILAVMDDVVFKVSGFLGLILLARYIGIYGLVWGIALGSWVAPFIHLIGLRKHLPFYKPVIQLKLAPVRKMFRLMLPLVVGTACIESRRLIDNFFASKLRVGSVTAVAYGYKLIEFAYVAIAEPLAVVVLPYFSDLAIQKDHSKLCDTLLTTIRTVILLFTPMGVCLFMLRYPVVRFLFERGEFDETSTQLTVAALTYYALGIVSFAVEIILVRAYFSMSDTLTPAIVEVVTITSHIGIIAALIGEMEQGSIALAFTLSKTMKVLILYGLLKRKLDDIHYPDMMWFLGKIAIAVGVMIALMAGYQGWFVSQFGPTAFFSQALLIGTNGAFGAVIFFTIIFVLKVREIQLIWQAISNYVKRTD